MCGNHNGAGDEILESSAASLKKKTFTTDTSTPMLSILMLSMNQNASRTKCSTSNKASGNINSLTSFKKKNSGNDVGVFLFLNESRDLTHRSETFHLY